MKIFHSNQIWLLLFAHFTITNKKKKNQTALPNTDTGCRKQFYYREQFNTDSTFRNKYKDNPLELDSNKDGSKRVELFNLIHMINLSALKMNLSNFQISVDNSYNTKRGKSCYGSFPFLSMSSYIIILSSINPCYSPNTCQNKLQETTKTYLFIYKCKNKHIKSFLLLQVYLIIELFFLFLRLK